MWEADADRMRDYGVEVVRLMEFAWSFIEPKIGKLRLFALRPGDRGAREAGYPCVTVNEWGAGKVWYIGTSPDAVGIFLLYRRILKEARIGAKFRGMGVEVIERKTEEGETVKVVLNHNAKAKRAFGRKIEGFGWAVVE